MKKVFLAIVLLFSLSATVTSCREKKSTSEKIEDAIDDAGDAIEDAADDVKDEVEDVLDKD
ncbi:MULTISPECIES: hypothetical protein [Mangrovimonas]|uniref:hypothetical protein n=1 Tax=Mangrovimonas TaxID=1211036 RepID=UPI0006B4C0BC|nr:MULTISPECIES: hypothetical protein [Mangrovimonas]OMP30723.1 hypothetical protein BKM32_10830 [Mangrovimonas sp. DI 80]